MGLAVGPGLTNGRRLVRAASVALFGAGLALAAARVIGSQFESVFFIPVGMAAMVGFVVARLPMRFRVLANVLVFVGSAFVFAAAAKASTSDVWNGLVDGPRQVLTTNWPSPQWPTICIALGSFVFIVVAIATDVAMRMRWRALAIAPLVLGLAAMLALGAPGGPQWAPLLCAAAAAFALLWVGLDDRVVSLRAGVVVAVAIGLTAAATSVAVAATHRADPRFVEGAQHDLTLLDPLAEVAAQLRQRTTTTKYSVDSPALARLTYWRTAALDTYDGESWSASGRVAPVGNIVNAGSGGERVAVKVSALAGTLLWPVPGSLLTSAQSIETDSEGRVVRIVGDRRPLVNVFTVEPLLGFDPSTAGSLPIVQATEIESSFQQRAQLLAGSGTVAQEVANLATSLRQGHRLDGTRSDGVQQGLIKAFLTDKVGNRSQFVTAFVLMARSLGVDARVAVGYRLKGTQGAAGQLTTADAAAWPEVRVANGWAAIDVVPSETPAPQNPTSAGARQDTPPAAQPAIPPEPEQAKDNASQQQPPAVAGPTKWTAIRAWARRIGLASALLLWPVAVFAAVVRAKKRRRRKGLRSPDPARRVTTAWVLATDALVDAGATLHTSQTNAELVGAGVVEQPAAGPPLGRLQRHADAVTFATAVCDDDRAADAVEQLRMIESSIIGSSSRWWRIKWSFSTRSLRRRTQSPLR